MADGGIRKWISGSKRPSLAFQAHPGIIWDIALSAKGDIMATAGEDGTVKVWHRWDTGKK